MLQFIIIYYNLQSCSLMAHNFIIVNVHNWLLINYNLIIDYNFLEFVLDNLENKILWIYLFLFSFLSQVIKIKVSYMLNKNMLNDIFKVKFVYIKF